MTAARLKRLARLESRQPSERPWRDPYDAAIRLCAGFQADRDAERAGRPFSKLPTAPPTPESEWSPPQREAMRYFDRLAARLAQEAT